MIGWLLDTHVISEMAKPGCDPRVAAWAESLDENHLFVSILSLAEFDKGIANLADGSPFRLRLEAAVGALEARFRGRVLPLDVAVVRRWGRMSGEIQRATGKAPPVIDTLLAATAIEYGLGLATRTVKDVRHSGAVVFDPWSNEPQNHGPG